MKFNLEATIHLHIYEDAAVLKKLDLILTAVKPLEKHMTDLELAFAGLQTTTDTLVAQNDALIVLTDLVKKKLDDLIAAGGTSGTVTVAAVQALRATMEAQLLENAATITRDTPVVTPPVVTP